MPLSLIYKVNCRKRERREVFISMNLKQYGLPVCENTASMSVYGEHFWGAQKYTYNISNTERDNRPPHLGLGT